MPLQQGWRRSASCLIIAFYFRRSLALWGWRPTVNHTLGSVSSFPISMVFCKLKPQHAWWLQHVVQVHVAIYQQRCWQQRKGVWCLHHSSKVGNVFNRYKPRKRLKMERCISTAGSLGGEISKRRGHKPWLLAHILMLRNVCNPQLLEGEGTAFLLVPFP